MFYKSGLIKVRENCKCCGRSIKLGYKIRIGATDEFIICKECKNSIGEIMRYDKEQKVMLDTHEIY